MMQKKFDRSAEDIGNVIALEHVNVRVPDQRLATLFYVAGLGLTRDPYLMASVNNMWVNVGRSQFHMPTGEPQVLRGRTGLVLPDREALLQRLDRVREHLDGTQFSFEAHNDYVDTVSPWGNRVRCHTPDAKFGRILLGMPYVELDVPVGTAQGIARFYREVMETPARVATDDGAEVAHVMVGQNQEFMFRETAAPIPAYDKHHIQVYVTNFSRPHARLLERGLVTEESDQWQFRFEDIVEPESNRLLFKLEHEVRSMTHPLYARPLVNRNPNQSNMAFAAGYETQPWGMPYGM
jgi:catechol 2,3-dioxygenase-like lactoylglutathione lyase family enzyme